MISVEGQHMSTRPINADRSVNAVFRIGQDLEIAACKRDRLRNAEYRSVKDNGIVLQIHIRVEDSLSQAARTAVICVDNRKRCGCGRVHTKGYQREQQQIFCKSLTTGSLGIPGKCTNNIRQRRLKASENL